MNNIHTIHRHNIVYLILPMYLYTYISCRIRVRQCSIQLYYASDNTSRILICINIFKYITSFPSIWITACVSLGWYNSNDTVRTAIFLAGLNSSISFLWDIGMDWGLISISISSGSSGNNRPIVIIRSRTYYYGFLYILAVAIDLVLRFTWAINRVSYFSTMHPSQIVLIIEVFEVLRRAMWNMLRIEWEIISKQKKMKILDRNSSAGAFFPSKDSGNEHL